MVKKLKIKDVLGEKNSIKRTIIVFSLIFILVTIFSNFIMVFQFHVASRQYEHMLQSVMSADESQRKIHQLKSFVKDYAETRNPHNYLLYQEKRRELDEELAIINEKAGDPSSIYALQSIYSLLEKTDETMDMVYRGKISFLNVSHMDENYDNILYMLSRVQNLEIAYAEEVYPHLDETLNLLAIVVIVILSLMVLMMVEFSARLHIHMYLPISRLVKNVREISKGNFNEPDIQIESYDELNYLSVAVNGMKKDLSLVIAAREEKINTERLLKETQFMALQSQVNPHFLFNVLGSATAMALKESADMTLDILESISYMLRYSLQSMKTNVSLRDEMRMVENYLFLQKQRFGDRIVFSMEIDDKALNTTIPGMTVQPLVENAMIHGCEKVAEGGWLKVICKLVPEEACVMVVIQNNGDIFSDEQLHAFRTGQNIPHGKTTTGIGLGNVRDRMHYYYNRTNLVECEVLDGSINIVRLRYPIDSRREL